MLVRNQAQLITYVDRLAGDLHQLTQLFEGPLDGLFGGVHLLPFFDPIDGADAGFDPVDHTAVDPRLGTWDDVEALGGHVPVMADLIVNHVSAASPQFLDWRRHGADSPYEGMFLTLDTVFPNGATEELLTAVYRPRPGLPLTTVPLADGTKRVMWTTFTPQQIDIDVTHPTGRDYLEGILDTFAKHGVTSVRLDAVGYAIKTAGTSCFMTPQTFAFIDELAASARRRDIAILVEIHSYWRTQVEIASRVDWVYDFALPPLVLHALYSGDATPLRRWCEVRPRNAVNVLDTHDGIGVIDVGPAGADAGKPGLLDPGQIDALVEGIHDASGGSSRAATGAAASNLDLYQVNCTYLDACGRDAAAYLIARLLQVWLPGIPQIYYVGLLAGENDVDLLQRTGVGRDINRHYYTPDEVEEALERPIVARLMQLLRFRNHHPAFGGEWELLDGDATAGELAMRWTDGGEVAELDVDVRARSYEVRVTVAGELCRVDDLLDLPAGAST